MQYLIDQNGNKVAATGISLGEPNMYYGSQYHLLCTPPYWRHRIHATIPADLEHDWCDGCGLSIRFLPAREVTYKHG